MGRTFLPNSQSQPASNKGQSLARSLTIIFLASILTVTVVYILLGVICCCIRRRLGNTDGRKAAVGVHDDRVEQVKGIPVLTYSRPSPSPTVSSCEPQKDDDIVPEPEVCSICLVEYEDGDRLSTLPECNHMFHKDCIHRWLLNRSSFCPICRNRAIHRTREPVTAKCWHDGSREEDQVAIDFGARSSVAGVPAVV